MCLPSSTTIGPLTPSLQENSPATNAGSSSKSRCGSARSAINEAEKVVELIQTFLRHWSIRSEGPSLPRQQGATRRQMQSDCPDWSGIPGRYRRQNTRLLVRLNVPRQRRRGTEKKRHRDL